ncbi:hypothetical protein BGX38DRAFT_1143404 [Terfezia claveryi]|nr:hypothetical protein BGX38DRAFT_1143404 [Terfezia claveryi]
MEAEIVPGSPPVIPTRPADPLWIAPKGKKGVRPTKQQYADSMGIDVTAYNQITALAKVTVESSAENLLSIRRWSYISRHDKLAYINTLHEQINALRRSDIDVVRARCNDKNILNHFGQEGWQRGRLWRRKMERKNK